MGNDIGPLRDRRKGTAAATIDRSHSDLAGEVPAMVIASRYKRSALTLLKRYALRSAPPNLNRCGGVFRVLPSAEQLTRKDRITWPAPP